MNNKGVDYIEVGRGNESKVIGQNNSISEYMATIFALGAYLAQGWVMAFTVVFLILGFYWLTWAWAAFVSFVVCTSVTVFGAWITFKALAKMKQIQEPLPIRDEQGKWRRARVNNMGKHVGDIYTAENGETEYVDQWGGGG